MSGERPIEILVNAVESHDQAAAKVLQAALNHSEKLQRRLRRVHRAVKLIRYRHMMYGVHPKRFFGQEWEDRA